MDQILICKDPPVDFPQPLYELINFFYKFPKHLKLEGLFRKCGSEPKMAELRVHLQFQDYEVLAEDKFESTEPGIC
jgi:hypothetical protein